ncbi:MAG: trimethylamine methyltransferase family protein [Promethearchaeota archaeon]
MREYNKNVVRPHYYLLTEKQINRLHLASLEILEKVGVKISHEEARKLLENNKCYVEETNLVHIPKWLVEESIQNAPSQIIIHNREGDETMRLEGNNNYYGLGTDLLRTIDLKTNELRLSILEDVKNAAIVADYCENVDFIASFALPSDVPTNLMYIQCAKTMMENSVKPIFFTAAGREDLKIIFKMAETISGGEQELKKKPFIIHYSEPTAPLCHSFGAVNKLFFCADKEIPICYPPGDIIGGTTPVTLAGSIAQANAEALSGIVLHQLRKKGAPIISGLGVIPLDMKTATFCYGAPEHHLGNSAFADLYHHYQIPMWSTVGSDAHCLDQQAAMEHSFATLLSSLNGANLIHDVGYMGQGLVGNPVSIVMCDEIISYVKRFIKGFELDRERLAFDIINKVGPGGVFLAEMHTVKHFREEIWRPKYLNRDDPETWIKKGKISYGEKVKMKTLKILKTHRPNQLSKEVKQKIIEILQVAEKKLINFKFKA